MTRKNRTAADATDHGPDTSPAAIAHREQSLQHQTEPELQRRIRFLQLLQVVSVAANGAPTSLADALQSTLDEVCAQTGWTIGHGLMPSDDGSGDLESIGIWHIENTVLLAAARQRHDRVRFARGVGVPGRVFASGRPEYVTDVHALSEDDEDRVRCSLIDAENLRAVAGFPIMVGTEVAGVLEFFSAVPFEADRVLLDVMVQVGTVLGRIVERTRYETALTQSRAEIEAAWELAEAASAAKSEFLSRMSHELRTPLNAVIGYAELLQLGRLPDEERQYVTAIENGGSHLLALINDVLEVARLERGRADVVMEAVTLDTLLGETIQLLQPLADSREVALELQPVEPPGLCVLGDHQSLKQVMINLTGNGIKFNHPGGRVTISVAREGVERVRVSVADDGPGVAEADLADIFVAFERRGAARTIEGTGLGLSISKRLVEAMDGTVEVQSKVGVGSTFSIRLNSSPGLTSTPGVLREPGTAIEEAPPRPRVLYIEDNVTNVELMESIFSRMRPGVELISVMLGECAVDQARRHAPKLILLDVGLPDIDGSEVLSRLKLDPSTAGIPVVMVSAEAAPARIEEFLAAGAEGYITKPIRVGGLVDVVDRAIGGDDGDDRVQILGHRPRVTAKPASFRAL